MREKFFNEKGYALPLAIIITGILMILAFGFIYSSVSSSIFTTVERKKSQTLEIADAGINYYLWHLAHDSSDFTDGNTGDTPDAEGFYGPYSHDYTDVSGNILGQYSIRIAPPPPGSSHVNVESTGTLNGEGFSRTIVSTLGIPSFADYAFLENDNMRFGEDAEVFGKIHANGGIRFDGHAHEVVTSAKDTYTDPDTGQTRPGVWTQGSGIFDKGHDFPVPAVDFNQITTDLAKIKSDAQEEGIYLGPAPWPNKGYYIYLNDNRIDAYRVINENNSASGPNPALAKSFVGTYNIPQNGLMFVEDNVWVSGTLDGRLTIAAARFPDTGATNKNITIISNTLYDAHDGSDQLGLIAQKDIKIPNYSSNNMTIDGALLAQRGKIYYSGTRTKGSLNINGAQISNQRGWFYIQYLHNYAGFSPRTYTYDPYLTLTPPPSFPTTGEYAILHWEEKK